MTKNQYLAQPDVSRFIGWLASQIDKPGALKHAYQTRKSKLNWECTSLFEAFENYQWKGTTFAHNELRLSGLRKRLRDGILMQHSIEVTETCCGILEWGGVTHRNSNFVKSHQNQIVELLEQDGNLLISSSPDVLALSKLHRFNSGFVKIYSLLLDSFVIYDSRVAAAIGLLIRNWCIAESQKTVPDLLHFRRCAAKEAANAQSPKQRDPSQGELRFKKLAGTPKAQHALCTIHASWLLKAVIEKSQSRFCGLADPLRALEAALFMVGYDLGATSSPNTIGESSAGSLFSKECGIHRSAADTPLT